MEEALHEITPMRQFARLTLGAPIPEDTTITNFRPLLERHRLAPAILTIINGWLQMNVLSLRQGTIVHAPRSTKNEEGKRDPEMHQTKKSNQYSFGMKTPNGADAENAVFADAGLIGVKKREGRAVIWQIAARRSTYSKLGSAACSIRPRNIEYCKAQTRAKVEHPFRVINRQCGYVKVRFRGLMQNTTHLTTLFALSNQWRI